MKETHKPGKRPAKENLIWSQRLGMFIDNDTGRTVVNKPVEYVRIAAGMDNDIFKCDR